MRSILGIIITDIVKSEDESERITVKEEIYKDAEIEICTGKGRHTQIKRFLLVKPLRFESSLKHLGYLKNCAYRGAERKNHDKEE